MLRFLIEIILFGEKPDCRKLSNHVIVEYRKLGRSAFSASRCAVSKSRTHGDPIDGSLDL